MADDDTIGLYVKLYTENFEANKRRLDSMISSIESNLGSLEQKQKAAADAAKAHADAEKKAIAEADKAAKADEAAIQKRERSFRKFAIVAAVATAAVVKGYQLMRDAATELGDTEAIAQFEAMDATLGALRDTVLQTGLEILKASDAIPFLTDRLQTLYQIAVLVGSGLAGFATGLSALAKAGKGFGIEDLGKPGVLEELNAIDFGAIQAQAQDAQRKALAGIVAAPERRREAEAEKEADKQREKTANNIRSYNEKIRDLQIKSGESILDAERDYHERSAEAWSSYMEKVDGIVAQGVQKRAELARAYSDAITSAETDYQRGAEDASYNHGKRLADIERDYQQRIRDIQQTYQEDALDAVRNLDAIGLIRARERRDKDLVNAEQSRDEANASESENYGRQLYELQRALDDKRREAEIAYQRGLEEQKRAEAEALQAAKNAYNQQTAEAAKAQADKLAAIRQGYNNENAAAQSQYGYSEQAYRNHLIAMQTIAAQYGIGATPRPATPVRRRAEGGLDVVSSPTQFVAGEAGPELVYTAPLSRAVPVAVPQVVNHVGDFSHSIDAAISSSVAGLDGRITAVVRKAIAEVIR